MKKMRKIFNTIGLLTMTVVLVGGNTVSVKAAASRTRENAIEIAYAELGSTDGDKYRDGDSGSWCVYYARWVARQNGLDTTKWPSTGSTNALCYWFNAKQRYHTAIDYTYTYNSAYGKYTAGGKSEYSPQKGDAIIVENDGGWGTEPDHTGIVYEVTDQTITTLEGNIGGRVVKRTYSRQTNHLTSGSVKENSKVWFVGFCEPEYDNSNQLPKGYLDMGRANNDGSITLTGWAADPDQQDAKLDIEVYFDDHKPDMDAADYVIYTGTARPDVKAAIGFGSNSGFDATFAVAQRGKHTIRCYAVDINTGERTFLGSKELNIKNPVSSKLSPSELSMNVGEEKFVDFECSGDFSSIQAGSNSTILNVTYEAKGDRNGVFRVSANATGNAKLIVIFYDSSNKEIYRDSILVSVTDRNDLELSFSEKSGEIEVGKEKNIPFEFKGSGIAGLSISYDGDQDVCSTKFSKVQWYVGRECPGELSVKGLKAGKTTVMVNMVDDEKNIIASFPIEITVKDSAPIVVEVPDETEKAIKEDSEIGKVVGEQQQKSTSSNIELQQETSYKRAFRMAKVMYDFAKEQGMDTETINENVEKKLRKWGYEKYINIILDEL